MQQKNVPAFPVISSLCGMFFKKLLHLQKKFAIIQERKGKAILERTGD